MQELTLIYTIYWLTVYFALLSISLYGYLNLRRNFHFASAAKYFTVVSGTLASFWFIWKFGAYLAGTIEAAQIKSSMLETASSLSVPVFYLTLIFSMIIFLSELFSPKIIRAGRFVIIGTVLFLSLGGILNQRNFLQTDVEISEFPPGEKLEYLQNFLNKEDRPSKLFIIENPYANAFVTGERENTNVFFTRPAVEMVGNKELLGTLTHELGHKFEPHPAAILRIYAKDIAAVIAGLFIFFVLAILIYSLESGQRKKPAGFGLIVKPGDEAGAKRLVGENLRLFPLRLAAVWVLVSILWLPSLLINNYLGKIEEYHADLASLRMLKKHGLPLDYLDQSFKQMDRVNYDNGGEYHWLYVECFSDHPSDEQRISRLNNYR